MSEYTIPDDFQRPPGRDPLEDLLIDVDQTPEVQR